MDAGLFDFLALTTTQQNNTMLFIFIAIFVEE